MINFIKYLIYKIVPSWAYYRIAIFLKNKRLKKTYKIFSNKKNFKFFFNINKKNKKIFIFGSGSSINKLNLKNYKEINKYHSIGINNWIFHKFITNYYMIELSSDDAWNEKIRLRILFLLKNKKKNPIFLIYRGNSNPKKIQNWMRGMDLKRVFLYEYLRPDIFKKDLEYQFMKSLEYLLKKNKKTNIITIGVRATIERSISLSLLLGYSQIIILGIDLKNTRVFWNNKDKNFKTIKSGQKAYGVHQTMTKIFGVMPSEKYILILDKVARQYYNSKVLITTNKSLLSSNLEKYKWKN